MTLRLFESIWKQICKKWVFPNFIPCVYHLLWNHLANQSQILYGTSLRKSFLQNYTSYFLENNNLSIYIYWVPLPTQLYCFLSSFKYVNEIKHFVRNCHLNDSTTFLRHQIQLYSAYALILALGYKNAFSVLHVHGLVMFQRRAQIQNLYRPPDEFMKTQKMSTFATQRQ